MKYLVFILLLLALPLSIPAYAKCDRSLPKPTLEQRRECIVEMVEGEVKRQHEIDLKRAEIEAVAQMRLLEASHTYILNNMESYSFADNYNTSDNATTSTSRSTNRNENSTTV